MLLISASVYEFASSQDTKIELKDLTYICRNLVRFSQISRHQFCTGWCDLLLRGKKEIGNCIEKQALQSHVILQYFNTHTLHITVTNFLLLMQDGIIIQQIFDETHAKLLLINHSMQLTRDAFPFLRG